MSIRLKLTLYWAAVLTAILAIAGGAAMILFARNQWGGLDGALMEEADTAAAGIVRLDNASAAGALLLRLSGERDLGPGHRVRIVAGDCVINDFGDTHADLPVLGATPPRGMRDGSHGRFRFAIVPFALAGQPAVIEDGVDIRPIRRSIAHLGTSLMLLLPLMLAACVAGGYLLAGRALVPIDRLARALAAIDPRELSQRLAISGDDDEVARLSRAINALLERVERAAIAERRFAADAAHELRTPLTVLRAGLEVALGRERSPADYSRTLVAALGEVIGLCAMADQLLTLARLDQEAAPESEALELGPIVREVAEAVEPLAQAQGLALDTTVAERVFVAGNRLQLKRLLINLIDNALAFTPAGGRIELTLAAHDGLAAICVADSGPGIALADLPQIFERFYRGAARADRGTGLGLSLCHEIARLHRGAIAAANRAGGGSEFVVTIPLLALPEGARRATVPAAPAA
ncbi:MAG: HAMP domain-containing histidine kinase [Candidatus Binataceae bacterium]|nr:HAMP domain-containing histidine kinase [Candidatus Binataceae bacterium]